MSDDDKESLKRDRPDEEAEPTEDEDISEPPKKVAKKSSDVEELKEEAKSAGDPPVDKEVCGGSECGTETEKGSEVDPSNEENEENQRSGNAESKEEPKEEEKSDSKAVDPPADTDAAPKDSETPPETAPVSANVSEEAKADAATDPSDAAPATDAAPDVAGAPTDGVSGLPPGVPSGLPHSPVDPTVAPTVTNPDSVIEERAELEKDLVGRVIGKGGEMIRDLQARSGCRVDVDQNVPPEANRIITYRGTRAAIDFAKQLVATLCAQDGRDAELPLGMATRKQLIVPSSSIGKIIGRGGEMIRDLQTRSKSKIQVDHSGAGVADPMTRQVIVTGTADSVVKAEEMILFLVANPTMDASTAIDMLVEDKARGGVWGSGPPYPNLPNQGRGMQMQGYAGGGYSAPAAGGYQQPGAYGGGYAAAGVEMEIFFAAKTYMGRVIGQRGVTINDLQKRSGCDIQINQEVPHGQDCEISIKGSRQGIEMVKTMLREIIEMGPNHPYAGGADAPQSGYPAAGGYQQPAYGQQPVAPYQYQQPAAQPVPYGGAYAYGAPAYQASPYGQPAMPPYGQAQPYAMPAYQPPPQQYAQPPMQQAPPPPTAVWRTATTADGQTYYYNEKTGETQWEKPVGM